MTAPAELGDALCTEYGDPEMWFQPNGANANYELARAVCKWCPVQAVCLEYVIDLEARTHVKGARYGLWGGKSGKERILIQRERERHAARQAM